jgi:hypothetical protein
MFNLKALRKATKGAKSITPLLLNTNLIAPFLLQFDV